MIENIKKIKVDGFDYPIAFTLNVMESIQDSYGSMEQWGKSLQPDEGEPKIKDIIWTFKEFINEGIDIENEKAEVKREFLSHKQVGRIISQLGMSEAGKILKSLSTESTETEEAKNA